MSDLRDKKTYLVVLEITIGEYEKHIRHLIEADNEVEAEHMAYENEQHCDSAEYDDELDAFVDDGGGMMYRACRITEVPWQDAVVLRKYFNWSV